VLAKRHEADSCEGWSGLARDDAGPRGGTERPRAATTRQIAPDPDCTSRECVQGKGLRRLS
jgi:hypothetical protein